MQDVLNISTTRPRAADEAPVNALQNVISNGTAVAGSAIGLHFHDNPTDRVSSLAVIPYFASVAFQNGADVYMSASDPASGTITFSNAPRGDVSRLQVLRTPNWPSSTNRIAINFNDYVQDINTWGECKRAKPSPCR